MAEIIQDDGEADVSDLSAGFQQLTQGLRCLQDALRLREQESERRMEEAFRQHEQRTTATLREAVNDFEEQLQQQDDVLHALRKRIEERAHWAEERAALMEQLDGFSTRDESEGTVEGAMAEQLEKRLEKLEEAIQKTINWMPHRAAVAARETARQENSHPEQAGGGDDSNQSAPGSLLGKRKK